MIKYKILEKPNSESIWACYKLETTDKHGNVSILYMNAYRYKKFLLKTELVNTYNVPEDLIEDFESEVRTCEEINRSIS